MNILVQKIGKIRPPHLSTLLPAGGVESESRERGEPSQALPLPRRRPVGLRQAPPRHIPDMPHHSPTMPHHSSTMPHHSSTMPARLASDPEVERSESDEDEWRRAAGSWPAHQQNDLELCNTNFGNAGLDLVIAMAG